MKRGYVHKLVKEFQEQDDTFSVWAGRHPSFSTSKTSKKDTNLLIKCLNFCKEIF
jgi:hypothetical protein